MSAKADEVRQVEEYLKSQGVEYLELVVASSIGADLAMAFLIGTKLPIGHIFSLTADSLHKSEKVRAAL